ncbi:MAG: class II glutamine amidotransferase [marine bacterium B5-7]|nr:MAG: class II glutamine amidotransferase [marine bacterium B5-7]
MCQLFGASSATPVRLNFSWKSFALRGSTSDGNPDGWGVANYIGHDVALFREPIPAEDSPLVYFLGNHLPMSTLVISHVRNAIGSDVSLANTHPFVRALGPHSHVFAHNGYATVESLANAWLTPIGETDSEHLFCRLLNSLEPLWRSGNVPPLAERLQVVNAFATAIRPHGSTNFLYSDGATLFAHGHRKTLPGRRISSEPGLHYCESKGAIDDPQGVQFDGPTTDIALVATTPLDDGEWIAFEPGEVACFEAGRRVIPD